MKIRIILPSILNIRYDENFLLWVFKSATNWFHFLLFFYYGVCVIFEKTLFMLLCSKKSKSCSLFNCFFVFFLVNNMKIISIKYLSLNNGLKTFLTLESTTQKTHEICSPSNERIITDLFSVTKKIKTLFKIKLIFKTLKYKIYKLFKLKKTL
jgi:hypothetical protein